MSRRARLAGALGAALLVGLLAAVPSSAAEPSGASPAASEARAGAWVLRVALSGGSQQLLQVADVGAASGGEPSASGTAFDLDGQGPGRAEAARRRRDAVRPALAWTDPTGSMTIEGGFAEAHVNEASSSARAGFGSSTGSGFAMAGKLFSWDQQEQLIGQWVDVNKTVFDTLNAAVAPLAAPLGALGVKVPVLEAPAAMAVVDVAKASQVAASAETTATPGLSSGRSRVSAAEVRLLGGFVDARDVASEAVSETTFGASTRSAAATIGHLTIAGVEVVADHGSIRVAANDLVSRAVVQPALAALITALRQAGITLRVVDTAAIGDLREAAALDVEVATPQGTLQLSVAHAEASAASVGGPPVASVDVGAPPSPAPALAPPAAGPFDTGIAAAVDTTVASPVEPAPAAPSPSGVATPRRSGVALGARPAARFRQQPSNVVRSLRTTYILLVVLGGLASALVLPVLVRPQRSVRRLPLGKELGK